MKAVSPPNQYDQSPQKMLTQCVEDVLGKYLSPLSQNEQIGLYNMVIEVIEEPLLKSVLQHVSGNLTKAAAILGISRSTLRGKLKKYRILY